MELQRKTYTQKNQYKNDYSNIIHNRQKIEKPKFPSADEWLSKTQDSHIMEYYVGIKSNEVMKY